MPVVKAIALNVGVGLTQDYWEISTFSSAELWVRFDCYLNFHHSFDAVKANRFGHEMTQPLVGKLIQSNSSQK